MLPRHIGADDAKKLFDECEEWIKTQFSEGKWFPSEAPNGVSLTWQEDDLAFLGGSGSENKVTAQLGAGEYCRVSEFMIPDILGEDEYLRGL